MEMIVDVTPKGLKTPEGQERVEVAIKARDTAAWEAANTLRELLKAINYDPGKSQLISILVEWYGDEEVADEFLNECFAKIKAVDETNEEFFKAVAGR